MKMPFNTNGFLNLLFGAVYSCCITSSLQLQQQLLPVNFSFDCPSGVENDLCTQSPPTSLPAPSLPTTSIYGYSVVITTSSDYYAYSFYYYLMLLILLMLAIISVRLAIRRRQAMAKTIAQQRSAVHQTNGTISVITSGQINAATEEPHSSNNLSRKDSDLPPAYDEAIRMNTNVQFQQRQEGKEEDEEEEGAVGGTTTRVTMSTITIATNVDDNNASADDITRTTFGTRTTCVNRQPSVFVPSPSNNSNNTNNIV